MKLKEVIEKAFNILENDYNIKYTKKYNRKYLIEGFSQTEISYWQWFGFKHDQNLAKQLSRLLDNKNKPRGLPYFNWFVDLVGYKLCQKCKKCLLIDNFTKETKNRHVKLNSICRKCDGIRLQKYKADNPEKVIETRKEAYRKKLSEDPTYFKRKGSLSRQRLKERTPPWADLLRIADIYEESTVDTPIDHIIPLNGLVVSGLHVHTNLMVLSFAENSSKGNKFIPYTEYPDGRIVYDADIV